ncbi:uncharacterized protein LOC112056012 isoform X1 [Bicyclus anynana]|uniref:Uncharacterized protein LOC112056012 isoform X1 n=1 Tax=Bicyclus anynana TaxID=110368 RepID=A0ABM3LVF6_BICAN|nr:uncharacterized protein LOC112056012 isoform X1 [Bicyclus anynana]
MSNICETYRWYAAGAGGAEPAADLQGGSASPHPPVLPPAAARGGAVRPPHRRLALQPQHLPPAAQHATVVENYIRLFYRLLRLALQPQHLPPAAQHATVVDNYIRLFYRLLRLALQPQHLPPAAQHATVVDNYIRLFYRLLRLALQPQHLPPAAQHATVVDNYIRLFYRHRVGNHGNKYLNGAFVFVRVIRRSICRVSKLTTYKYQCNITWFFYFMTSP